MEEEKPRETEKAGCWQWACCCGLEEEAEEGAPCQPAGEGEGPALGQSWASPP